MVVLDRSGGSLITGLITDLIVAVAIGNSLNAASSIGIPCLALDSTKSPFVFPISRMKFLSCGSPLGCLGTGTEDYDRNDGDHREYDKYERSRWGFHKSIRFDSTPARLQAQN